MADSPPADATPPTAIPPAEAAPPSPKSGNSTPSRRKRSDLEDEILKGAAWAPPFTKHELHAREVYQRARTPSPPCGKYPRDAAQDEINPNVMKKRQEDEQKSLQTIKDKRKHESTVQERALEFEKKCRTECEKRAKRVAGYNERMKKKEEEQKGPYKNRAEQIIALGLNKPPGSRPQSPPDSPKPA
jgi:hypothetical protein